MMFWRRNPNQDVQEGGVYQRRHGSHLVEQAQVVWVGEDQAGIPHVRFRISYLRPDMEEPQGTRMLALASFAERYGRRTGLANA